MRRKPVVVAGVAAVVLGVGVLAAGQAGAEETPQRADGAGSALADGPAVAHGSDVDDRSDLHGVVAGADLRERAPARHAQRPVVGQLRPVRAVHAVQEQSQAEKPGVTTVRRRAAKPRAMPDKPEPAERDAGLSLTDLAKKTVTAADVSTSPASPVQQQILALINQDRRQHGCGRVTLDRRLIGAANAHAADMAEHGYFTHNSRDGKDPGYRVTRAGFVWKRYGENIARGVGSAYGVVDSWMNSPEHRQNILDCALARMGIGVAVAGDNQTVYWVQDFATPM